MLTALMRWVMALRFMRFQNNVLDESHVSNGENFKSCRIRGKERIMINLQTGGRQKPVKAC